MDRGLVRRTGRDIDSGEGEAITPNP